MYLLTRAVAALVLVLTASPLPAQTADGAISGRLTDMHGAPVPGARVEAVHRETGYRRETVTDEWGTYRLPALPVGVYRVSASLEGFAPLTRDGIVVNVGRTVTLDAALAVGAVAETVTVRADSPLVATRSSGVGEVIDLNRIEHLPLNGRQFANLAALVPGVGLGFHADPTKGTQYAPQISGGNGRNINYVVDGGDNNDDTVGGLLQLFPLEAIQEFEVVTQRFDADYGRSNGGLVNVVTRSGTNEVRGSWFTLVRDDALNSKTFVERRMRLPKQPYSRTQFGGSLGGPLVRDRAHYFAAFERTRQQTIQVVNTLGIYPEQDGLHEIPLRENLFTLKLTAALRPDHSLSVRYGRSANAQPSGAGLRFAPSTWSPSRNWFDSVNVDHNWLIRGRALNSVLFQFSDFVNDIPRAGAGPSLMFPSGVRGGGPLVAPQRTEQRKWQYKNDFSWVTSRLGGLAHEVRAGVNWVHEPRLFVLTGQGTSGVFTMLTDDPGGPVREVTVIGGATSANTPIEQVGVYVQDDWRAANRLTLNLGLRWDYVAGMPIDQRASLNFQAMQAAGRTGRFAGTLLEDFGADPRGDRDNVQPRVGAVLDLRGDGRDILRGGWGIYTDFGYVSSNALVAAFDAAGGAGLVFAATSPTGLRKPDGTYFLATDPLSAIADQNLISGPPRAGEVVSPRLEQPYSFQTNAGWSHLFEAATAFDVHYVRVDGRDLNMRVRPNVLVDGRRYLAGVGIEPQNHLFRVAVSKGTSRYDALILGLRRRMSRGVDVNASYTLARATSDIGTASDEVAQNLIQDIRDPFGPAQQAPSYRTDARHQISLSAIVDLPGGVSVAPIFFYRSALPVHTAEGVDLNGDGVNNDRTAAAYAYTGLNEDGVATYVETGRCETVNCSRRAPFSQLNVRVGRAFRLAGSVRVDAFAEVFNVFNAANPWFWLTQARLRPNGTPNPQFMQPAGYAGEVGQPEQRVGQIGFRVTF